MNQSLNHFKQRQAKIIAEASKQRKEEEKQRIAQAEKEYWADVHDQEDYDVRFDIGDWDEVETG